MAQGRNYRAESDDVYRQNRVGWSNRSGTPHWIERDIAHGGWCPRVVESKRAGCYQMKKLQNSSYAAHRIEPANSKGTVVFSNWAELV